MAGFELTDIDKKILSYCSRGVSRDGAIEKISEYFGLKSTDVNDTLKNLRNHGFIIENKTAGVPVIITSPLKVKSSMLDQKLVAELADREHSARASGFKKHKVNIETGEIEDPNKKKAVKPKQSDLGFDVI